MPHPYGVSGFKSRRSVYAHNPVGSLWAVPKDAETMIYLTNAVPNGWLFLRPALSPIEAEDLLEILTEEDLYQDHDDVIRPRKIRGTVKTAVGHESTAAAWSTLFGSSNGAKLYGETIPVEITSSRDEVIPVPGDTVIAGLFVAPRRLKSGERWTEEELLSNTKWLRLDF